jgi:GTP cyclohydrolase II
VPVEPTINAENATYITTKVERMNHLLDIGISPDGTQK